MLPSHPYRTIGECACCRSCKGAAYQTVPALYAGPFYAPILVIAQNPGEIRPGKDYAERFGMARHIFNLVETARIPGDLPEALDSIGKEVLEFYNWDFGTSNGCRSIEHLLGIPDWLNTGAFVYTNAVLCRTEGNASPSGMMVENCWKWTTEMLRHRSGVILFGGVAAKQFPGVRPGLYSLGHFRNNVPYLALPHWAAPPTTTISILSKTRALVLDLLAEAGVTIKFDDGIARMWRKT